MRKRHSALVFSVVVLAALVWPAAESAAQGFGIGPRMSFVKGDLDSGAASAKFYGGTIRMRSSRRVVLELAADIKTQVSADGLTRLRERPVQGSLLLFLARSAFAPYVLGGYGLYPQTTETLNATGLVTDSVTERKTGGHLGFGAELFLGRHAALFADYRFRFVKLGAPDEGADPLNIPGGSFVPGLDKVQLSHRGTMWTSGIAFYF
jgi:Outer membrane protein beta-barrel domain